MGDLSAGALRLLLQRNVVELKFVRRHPKPNWSDTRRMLCTNCRPFLNSLAGRITLKFNPPTHPPAYDAKAYNLVCAFDCIFLQYRMIPVESVVIVAAYPVYKLSDQKKFWEWFSQNGGLAYWSEDQKIRFMNS